jgi:NAD(P)-dependent dehydrogenase (short-subunit alcohol dehydrogenase family)
MKDLKGKVAVVTGAASGIGAGLARAFADEGMNLVIADIEADRLAAVTQELEAKGAEVVSQVTDVSQKDQVIALADQAYERFGAVHVLCNNAGVTGSSCPIWETPDEDWRWIMTVNLRGILNGLQAFVPRMLAQDEEGVVMNTSSFVGLSTGSSSVYGISKHAITRLTEGLHYDLKEADSKLRAALLAPGAVASDFGISERNRPKDLKLKLNAEEEQDRAGRRERIHNWLAKNGMPPEEVAQIALQGIKEGRFYIFTNREEVKTRVEKRMKGILEEGVPLD